MERPGTDAAVRVVAGRYRLLEELGRGGMGTVWRAHDDVLDREVAVKELTFPAGLPDGELERLRERTRREARAAAALHHPSAVTVHDVVEDDGVPFIVMELVPARTLADVVRADGPLPPVRVAEVGLAVLGALEAAHRRGIVHRDVKPGNVLLCEPRGRVVLTDFGIATTTGDPSLTTTGLVLGSPAYIAPERGRGVPPGPESDLWSLGATLFTAVEGRPPYDGGDALATVAAVMTGERSPFVAAGPLEPVLDGLLDRDPARRLDAAAARAELERVARSRTRPVTAPVPVSADDAERVDRTTVLPVLPPPPAAAPPVPPPPVRPARPVSRSGDGPRAGTVAAAVAGVLLVGAAVGVGALVATGDDEPSGTSTGAAQSPTTAPSTEPPATAPAPVAEQPAAEQPAVEGEEPPAADETTGVPAGWRTVTGGPGWTAAVPPSWQAGSFNGDPEYRDPATGRTLRISTTGPGGGKDDAVQDRRDQAESFEDRHPDYREISIEPIEYRGYEAADWEFTYEGLHALSRVFVVDGRGYSLFFQTRQSDDWSAAREQFETVARAFQPA